MRVCEGRRFSIRHQTFKSVCIIKTKTLSRNVRTRVCVPIIYNHHRYNIFSSLIYRIHNPVYMYYCYCYTLYIYMFFGRKIVFGERRRVYMYYTRINVCAPRRS